MSTFADRLKQLRKERGLKQREMAELCHLKLRGYQQYEYSEAYPTVPGLLFLADCFSVSLDYLMGRTDRREINRPPEDSSGPAQAPSEKIFPR